MLFRDFNSLKKNLKKSFEGFTLIKVALLGDSSTQLLSTSLRGYGFEMNLDLEIYEADYDQIDQEIFNTDSKLFKFQPEIIFILQSSEKISKRFNKLNRPERLAFAKNNIERHREMFNIISSELNSKVVFSNFAMRVDTVFGHFSSKVEESFQFQLRKINFLLAGLSVELGNLFICDINGLQSKYGTNFTKDNKLFVKAQMIYSLEFLPILAGHLVDILLAIKGIQLKKCLILDLDNTTWGGIIGDDGIEKIQVGDFGIGKAFTNLQLWAKELKERGIILCICSKNTEEVAKVPFEKHPDMILRLDDISVFVANWENKADNIRHIQNVLNIGFDSMVFLDDNPFERNLVRQELPEVTVPELPEDPSDYLDFVTSLNLFETASFSSEDKGRTIKYQQEAKRVSSKRSYNSITDYLKSLNMEAEVNNFNEFNIPRSAQLSQRSNQFNLRTIRYTEGDLKDIMNSETDFGIVISLKDKYGEYGIISVLICKKKMKTLFIDTWIMSCRVLKRNVELFVLDELVEIATNNNCTHLQGEYIKTAKNKLVENHYKDLNFTESKNGFWDLDIQGYQIRNNLILKK